jgi:hypothetical protein
MSRWCSLAPATDSSTLTFGREVKSPTSKVPQDLGGRETIAGSRGIRYTIARKTCARRRKVLLWGHDDLFLVVVCVILFDG